MAKDDRTHWALARELAARRIERRYLALAQGHLEPSGTVDAPIARHPRDRRRMAVVPGGRTLTVPASATSVTVTGLRNGTAYRFTVAAANALGGGPPSAPSPQLTPATPTVLSIGRSAAAVGRGRPLVLSGALRPALAGARLVLYARRAGTARWLPLARVTTDARGRARATVRPAATAAYAFAFRGSAAALPSTSPATVVRASRP